MAKPYELHGIPNPFLNDRGPPEYAIIRDEDLESGTFLNPYSLAPGDLRLWGNVSYWTALEAALLLEGISPDDDELYAAKRMDMSDSDLETDYCYSWKYMREFYSASQNLFLFERSALAPRAAPIEWVKYYNKKIRQVQPADQPKSKYSIEYYGGWLDFFSGELAECSLPEALVLSQVDDLEKRDIQYELILAVCAALGFDPQQIPDGGKAKIKSVCLTRPRLFTDSSFDRAWKDRPPQLFKMANHEKFSPK